MNRYSCGHNLKSVCRSAGRRFFWPLPAVAAPAQQRS